VSSAAGGRASGELINKGFPLESSVDPPSLTTYMSSSLSSLTSTANNVAMTLTGSIGNFSYNSQKLLSPAEFISSPPHSLSTFAKVTPSDFSSALPSVSSSTAVAVPATPTSVTVQTTLAPPPVKSTVDSFTEVSTESPSNSDGDEVDDKVTPQETVQSAKKSFEDICETLDLQQPEVNLSKISTEVSLAVLSDQVFHPETVEGESNKLMTSQHQQFSEVDGWSPHQRSEVLQIEGRVSQTSSDFASANDQDSECEEDPAIDEANKLVNTELHSKPHPEAQLFPDMLPSVTGQPITASGDIQSTNNNLQFLQCNNCSTFNSSEVLNCSHCGCVKNDQWTPQNFLKAIATQNSTDFMIAQSPSTVDAVALSDSTSTVESPAAAAAAAVATVVGNKNNPSSYTAVFTAAPDHSRVSLHAAIVTESPRNSNITLYNSSSLQATAATAVDKETDHSIESYLPSSSSVESSSYSMNHQELTRSVVTVSL